MVRQEGPFWCIPACFENLLRAGGLREAPQADIVAEYCRQQSSNALGTREHPIALPLDPADALALARHVPLKEANFAVLKDVVEALWDLDDIGARLELQDSLDQQSAYIDALKASVDDGSARIMCASNGLGGWHVGVFFGYAGDVVEFFDPATGQVEKRGFAQLGFSDDLVQLVGADESPAA
jgi:hypothetical protein